MRNQNAAATRGVEKVLALATLGAEWRDKVLADPVSAALDAGVELSDTEQSVLRSTPRPALEQMIDSFHKSVPRPAGLGRLAAAAAVALIIAAAGCEQGPPATKGMRPQVPPPKSTTETTRPPATDGIRPDLPAPKPAPERPQPPAEK